MSRNRSSMRFRAFIFVSVASTLPCASARAAAAQASVRTLTIDAAIDEAVERNVGLLAERVNLSVADAAIVTARLRPNPVVSGGANSLDWLGTGFNDVNNAGPPEYSVRVDMPFERGGKREPRMNFAAQTRKPADAAFAEAVR